MVEYFDSVQGVGIRLTRIIAKGLGLDPEFFARCCVRNRSTLKIIHYTDEVRLEARTRCTPYYACGIQFRWEGCCVHAM